MRILDRAIAVETSPAFRWGPDKYGKALGAKKPPQQDGLYWLVQAVVSGEYSKAKAKLALARKRLLEKERAEGLYVDNDPYSEPLADLRRASNPNQKSPWDVTIRE